MVQYAFAVLLITKMLYILFSIIYVVFWNKRQARIPEEPRLLWSVQVGLEKLQYLKFSSYVNPHTTNRP